MGKRLSIILLTLSGLVILAGLSLYIYRLPLSETLISQQLRRQGIPVRSLIVADVSLKTITLRNLSLGSDNELRADEIIANWELGKLLTGELGAIDLSGVQLALDLSNEGRLLGSLQHLVTTDDNDSSSRRLPLISLRDSRIKLHTDLGDFIVIVNGDIEQKQTGTLSSRLAVEINGPLGRTRGQLDASMEAGGNIQGKIILTESAFSLPEAEISGLTGHASFTTQNIELQQLNAELQLSDITLSESKFGGLSFEQANISLQMDDANAKLTGNLHTGEKNLSMDFDTTVSNYLREPDIGLELNARGTADHKAWGLLGLPDPDTGSVNLSLKASGHMPPFREARDNYPLWLQHSTFTGLGQLAFENVNYPQKISDLQGEIAFSAEFTNGTGKSALANDALIQASSINPAWLESFGIPAEFTEQLVQGVNLHIGATGDQATQINFRHYADGTELNITGSATLSTATTQTIVKTNAEVTLNKQDMLSAVKLSDLSAQAIGWRYADTLIDRLSLSGNVHGLAQSWTGNVDLESDINALHVATLAGQRAKTTLPIQINFEQGIWQINLRRPGRVSLEKLAPLNSVNIPGPLTASLPRADIKLTTHPEGLAFTHNIAITPTNFSVHVERDEAPSIDAYVQSANITLAGKQEAGGTYHGQGDITVANATLPQTQLQLDNITMKLNLDPGAMGRIADFGIGHIQHTAASPYFAPHSMSGSVARQAEVYSLDAIAGVPGTSYAKLGGEYAIDSGMGKMEISIPSLHFAAGGLQPGGLINKLAVLKDVVGAAGGNAQLSWSKEGISNSHGFFKLQDTSFKHQDIAINGLDAALTLNDLFSPTLAPKSPPGQRITIHNINLGVPMENLSLAYQVQATRPPSVAIEDARLSLIGGTMSIVPTVIDPSSTQTETIIQVEDLDLATFFRLIKVPGLTGTGRLDGNIPITLEGKRVAIHKGQLDAGAPGILRFKSERASQLLSGAGKEMNLLLEALQEFHYTELTLKLDKSINDDLVATLSLLGNNPQIRSGQLFRLNINFESNIGQILDSIAQGYLISNEALRDIFRLR